MQEQTESPKITKNEIDKFLNFHPLEEFSAARFEYSLYLTPEVETIADMYIAKHLPPSAEDRVKEDEINNAASPDALIRLMRQPLSGANRKLLRNKLIQSEKEIITAIKNKSLTNRQDLFIENALYFFLHSEENCCSWIVENYDVFKSEYLKSMLCLVLGFRGNVSLIPMMMKETERFEKFYPFKSYNQGPILAVSELADRFFDYSF